MNYYYSHKYTCLRKISGARYSGVPQRECAVSPSTSFFDKPKSVIRIWPSGSNNKFSGFKSRYTILLSWRWPKPKAISAA